MLSGQTTEAFWNSIRHAQPLFVGLNCALGGKQLRPYIEELAGIAETYVCAYPNAGLPNAFGEYDESPARPPAILDEFGAAGLVNIVGGCCGTTPDHIRLLRRGAAGPRAARVADRAGEVPSEPASSPSTSTRQPVRQRRRAYQRHRLGEVPQADRGRRLRRLRSRWRASRSASGAQIIDINMDEGMLDSEAVMVRFLQPDRRRAGHRARAGDDRLLQVVGDRGGPQMRAGQGNRQLDQHEGGRGDLHRARPQGAPLRCRRGGHGI